MAAPSNLFSNLSYFLDVQMHFCFRRLLPKAGIGCHSIISDFALLDRHLQEFKSFGEAIEKFVVSIVGALGLVGVLEVEQIETVEV